MNYAATYGLVLAAGAAPAQKHTVDQQERRPIEPRGNADDGTIISYGGVPARSRRTFPAGPPALGTQVPERLGDLPARRRYRRALHVPGGSRPDRYEDLDRVPPQRGTRECPRGEPLLLDRPGRRIPHPLPSVPCRAHHRRDGAPCERWAIRGATVCPSHGGNAPQVRRVAGEREAIDRALRAGFQHRPDLRVQDLRVTVLVKRRPWFPGPGDAMKGHPGG